MSPTLVARLRALARSPWTWLVLGGVLRLIHIAIMGNRYYFGDTAEYQSAALRMLHGLGLSGTAPRAPLYPMFMALSFRLGGEGNYVFTRLLNFVLALALIMVVSRLAARIGGPAAGMLAASMMAIAPTMVFTAGLLYPTTLYMLLLASMTLVAWDLGEQPQLGRGLALGALFALGWLTDQVFIAPSAAIALWLLWRLRQHGMALARALAAAVIMAATLAYPYALALERQTSDGVFMRKAQSVLFSARTDPVLSHERWITYPPAPRSRPCARMNSSCARATCSPITRSPICTTGPGSSSTSSVRCRIACRPRTATRSPSCCTSADSTSSSCSRSRSSVSDSGADPAGAASCWRSSSSEPRRSIRSSSRRPATASRSSATWSCSPHWACSTHSHD
jgi:hypothetical protein